MPSFELERRIAASPDIVWEVLTDHAAYANWGAAKSSTLETRGTPDPNGIGAVRKLTDGPLSIREKVLEFSPKTRFVYTIVSGPPVRDYRATVTLTPDGDCTMVRWTTAFAPRIPLTGPLLLPVVKRVIGTLLEKASAEAARRAREGTSNG